MDERLRQMVVNRDAMVVLDQLFEMRRAAATDRRKIPALLLQMAEVRIRSPNAAP